MKRRNLIPLLAFLIVFSATGAFGQQNEKITEGLQAFLNTEFMQSFKDMKLEMEGTAMAFKQNSGRYDQASLLRVKVGYDKTASRFNQLLGMIQADFMDSKKLRFITNYPEEYSYKWRFELGELSSFYAQNYQQVVSDMTGDQLYGSAFLLLIPQLITVADGLVSYISKIKQESKMYTEAYLKKHLIEPYRVKSWDELGKVGDDFDQYTPVNDPMDAPYYDNDYDPFAPGQEQQSPGGAQYDGQASPFDSDTQGPGRKTSGEQRFWSTTRQAELSKSRGN